MKANELQKRYLSIDEIYKTIEGQNEVGYFKMHIPHYVCVKEDVLLQLMQEGFKVSKGNWDGFILDAIIIEW